MYVCLCRTVTDLAVIAEIHAGARSVREIARRCGAGGRCGGCYPEVARLLALHESADQACQRGELAASSETGSALCAELAS